MRLSKLLVSILIGAVVVGDFPSAVSAASYVQIDEGDKCGRLNQIIEEGFWSYKCTKVRKKKLWQFNGMSSTTTTSAPTTTLPPTTTTTTIPTAPIAPSSLVFTMKSPFDGTGTLSWTDNSNNEDNFYISTTDPAKLVGQPLSSLWYKASKNQTSVNLSSLSNGYNYCFWGMSSNVVGNSIWSDSFCALAGTATTTTTTTIYVPPTTAYVPTYGGGSSSANWLGCYFKGKKMWGSVYITPYSFAADVIVYQTPYSFNADLKVYKTPYSFAATSCGIWYVTPYSFAADFTVYISQYFFNADFSMYITPYSFSAGR